MLEPVVFALHKANQSFPASKENPMNSVVKWTGDLQFVATSSSGHSVVLDGQGGNTAPSPMEMVLMAAGGCSSVDVVDGLKQAGQNITGCQASLTTERREQAPKLFTKINIHFAITGHDLDESLVEQVTRDSLTKYCSVCLMLGAGVEMTHTWSIAKA